MYGAGGGWWKIDGRTYYLSICNTITVECSLERPAKTSQDSDNKISLGDILDIVEHRGGWEHKRIINNNHKVYYLEQANMMCSSQSLFIRNP